MPPKLPQGATYLSLPQIFPTGGTGDIRDIEPNRWFSVLKPVRPQAPAGTRVRQYSVQPGANLAWTPGSENTTSHGFALLREIADTWDLLRIIIETVKDRICSIPWDVRLIAEPGEKKSDLEARTKDDPRIAAVRQFLKFPDGIHPWRDWLRMGLEDMLVLDAWAIYLERDLKGKIANLRPIDGATIERVVTDQGFTPQGADKDGKKDVAYQQILYGVPAIDLTTDDLVYTMRNPRTWKRYGYGPVEQMVVTIAIGISRQQFVMNEYKEGNIPEAICFLPSDVPIDKVKEAQDWFDTVFAGNLAMRRRLTFLPGYGNSDRPFRPNIVFPKQQLLKDIFDEWQMQIVAYGMGTTPQALMKMMNRATAQQSAESAEEEGLEPKLRTVEDVINHVIQDPDKMGFDDIEFSYQPRRETDPLKQMQVDTGYSDKAVITLNEARIAMGKDPYDVSKYPEADEPGVFSPTNGWMPLAVQSQIERTQKMISAGVRPDPQAAPANGNGKPPKPGAPKKPAVSKEPDAKKLFRMETSDGSVYVSKSRGALVKAAKKIGGLTINPAHSNAETMAAKSKIDEALKKIFRRQKDRAAHVATGLLQKVRKADNSAEIADEIYAAIEAEFSSLPVEVRAALEQAAIAGVDKGIIDVHLTDSSLISAVNKIAQQWAAERAAEMVGMKFDVEGALIPNPNAQWVISDTTRDELRTIIKDSFGKETPMTELVQQIRDAGAFSEARADMIARTEVANAQVKGNWEVWKSTGLVESVQWLVSDNENVCDECEGNDGEVVKFGEGFPSGDESPPAHPNCQCVVVAADITGEGESGEEE
jgi:SPP1 gp7 family putative phage head morphogenesis protein